MAQWIGICGVRLKPLAEALQAFILGHAVVRADDSPVSLLAPGRGKTRKAYVWVYRTTNFVAQRAVLYDFCASRAGAVGRHWSRRHRFETGVQLPGWVGPARSACGCSAMRRSGRARPPGAIQQT